MTDASMKSIVAMLSLGSAAVLASEAAAHLDGGRVPNGWVCNAYGYGGPRNTWSTVTGERTASQAAAEDSAMRECQKKLNACRRSGCWSGG